MKTLYEVLEGVEGSVLPDEDSPFWDWFWGQVEISNLVHEIDKNLFGETAWDYFRRKAKENQSSVTRRR